MNKRFLLVRIAFFAFSLFLFLTFFMPSFELNEYTEYQFNYGYENKQYQSSTKPLATKISAYDMVKMLFVPAKSYTKVKADYAELEAELAEKLTTGELSAEEYNEALASDHRTSQFYLYSIYFRSERFEILQQKITTYCIVFFALWILFFVYAVLNFINIFANSSLLITANYQISLFCSAMWLIYIIFCFAFSSTAENMMLSGRVVQTTITAGAPKFIAFFSLVACIAFFVIAKVFNNYYQIEANRLKEVPDIIAYKYSKPKYKHSLNKRK